MKQFNLSEIKITREQLPVVALVSALAAVIAVYFLFFAPLMGRIRHKAQEAAGEEAKLSSARKAIAQADKFAKDIVMMRETDIPTAIEELTDYGKKLGVTFYSIKPGEIIRNPEKQYNILPLELDMGSTDKQCAAFLGSLDALKKSLVRVMSFDITPDGQNRAVLRSKIAINIYFAAE